MTVPLPRDAARPQRPRSARLPALAAWLFAGLLPVAARGEPRVSAWELVSRSDGITVKRRKVEGWQLQEFLGIVVLDSPLVSVLAVLRDADSRKLWSTKCVDSRLLEQPGEWSQILYDRFESPWPVKDRDTVLFGEISLLPGEARITFHSIDYPALPPIRGVVRMPYVRGQWVLRPVRGGEAVEVEYQVHADPGGAIPDWLSNLVSKKLPLKTLQALRVRAKQRLYPDFERSVLGRPEYATLLAATSAGSAGAEGPAPTEKGALPRLIDRKPGRKADLASGAAVNPAIAEPAPPQANGQEAR